ncbi:cation diffusion facilitator family transporter [Legionella parisiensis]|uniref:Cadmium, cobalt and zinc/H(+)-K(+) antiporter n=1 Tax=Legionella parisiensis TaxID=45071 RepID=A0A1E5JLC9_9GAMM|nr:cation transporter [Legionella parisiensis]KTD43056.1 cobalt zinc cadmium cation transporter [Legionella parisiensis]OEH45133.1 Cadmium, cobalt and zinc/H(+)-K(+) antiporter [Legionella parisiensis]STX77865.1 Co/Zn/Cd cation transporter [Legionella parisiensis]
MAVAEGAIEQRVLKISIVMTSFLSLIGIICGLLSGSLAIIFDGMFDMIDAVMSVLALLVARLLTSEGNRRFQYGYWHVEPMVLVFNGSILILVSAYALINAIGSMLSGGRETNFDLALIVASFMSVLSIGMYGYVRHKNLKINSEFLRLDAHSWLMSGSISLALLVAFVIAQFMDGSRYQYLTPFIDPFVLGIMSTFLFFVPMSTVRNAMRDIFLIAPFSLDEKVRLFLDDLIKRYEFKTYSSYVAKIGRAQFIEIHIVVPPEYKISNVESLDVIRHEIAVAMGGESPQRWLTIVFTANESWI